MINHIIRLLIVVLIIATIGFNSQHTVLGTSFGYSETKPAGHKLGSIQKTADGSLIISTADLAAPIRGYAGNIPLKIYVRDGLITRIEPLENSETPSFMKFITRKGFFGSWNGLTLEEASTREVDTITGATMSTDAIIQSVRLASRHALGKNTSETGSPFFQLKTLLIVLVILAGLCLPLFFRSKKYRTLQLALNVAVLGFWGGTFVSLSMLTGFFSSPFSIALSAIPVLLIIAALIMPLAGKRSHYCFWLCPMGSAQELIGRIPVKKIRPSAKTLRKLTLFREALWFTLMLIMLCGTGLQIMDYEIFPAFLFSSASLPVLIAAGIFLLLSLFINRPYCRFVCPTGTLLKLIDRDKEKKTLPHV